MRLVVARIAQLVEQDTLNVKVLGSNPSAGTMYCKLVTDVDSKGASVPHNAKHRTGLIPCNPLDYVGPT